jgi:hypothetical protein
VKILGRPGETGKARRRGEDPNLAKCQVFQWDTLCFEL